MPLFGSSVTIQQSLAPDAVAQQVAAYLEANPVDMPATSTFQIEHSVAGTNASLVATGEHTMHGMDGYNSISEPIYVRAYNLNRSPNVGVDVPVFTKPVPGQSTFTPFTLGPLKFQQGIAVAFTMGPGVNDAQPIAADALVGFNISYS